MILGVTGFFCSGKDTLAEYFQKRHFAHISLSDMIRDEIRARGEEITLERLTATGNELRQRFGAGILAVRALKQMNDYARYLVTSIRHPGEIETLRIRRDFLLIFADAPAEKRYERCRERGRAGDNLDTFEKFIESERQQLSGSDPNAQQLRACHDMADILLDNDSTLEAFYEKANETLRDILTRRFRPAWDDYFMNIAHVAASRANCLSRQVGAAIVKDKQIISTGYNGTPKGIRNCNEGGCPRCWSMAQPGSRLDECLCVHAEENAIVQAACNGTSIQGATLYTTYCPCCYCAKSIINAGIKRVVFREAYAMDKTTESLFAEAGVAMACLNVDGK